MNCFSCLSYARIHKIKIKNLKTKIPRITDEGWNSQKWLSGPCSGAEEGREEKKAEKKRSM